MEKGGWRRGAGQGQRARTPACSRSPSLAHGSRGPHLLPTMGSISQPSQVMSRWWISQESPGPTCASLCRTSAQGSAADSAGMLRHCRHQAQASICWRRRKSHSRQRLSSYRCHGIPGQASRAGTCTPPDKPRARARAGQGPQDSAALAVILCLNACSAIGMHASCARAFRVPGAHLDGTLMQPACPRSHAKQRKLLKKTVADARPQPTGSPAMHAQKFGAMLLDECPSSARVFQAWLTAVHAAAACRRPSLSRQTLPLPGIASDASIGRRPLASGAVMHCQRLLLHACCSAASRNPIKMPGRQALRSGGGDRGGCRVV